MGHTPHCLNVTVEIERCGVQDTSRGWCWTPQLLDVSFMPISISDVKVLSGDKTLSDIDAEKVVDTCRKLAELLFDKWLEDKKSKRKLLTN